MYFFVLLYNQTQTTYIIFLLRAIFVTLQLPFIVTFIINFLLFHCIRLNIQRDADEDQDLSEKVE